MKILEGLVLLKLILLSNLGQMSKELTHGLPYINNLNDLDITEGGFCGRENNDLIHSL